jgi:tetratricopeptide (TPR) repeat protein
VTYTLRSIQDMLGLGRGAIVSLIDAGFVTPGRGPKNEYRFSFQDVVLLRTAHLLRAAEIPSRRMLRALKLLKSRLPEELPLSGLRITAIGNDVAVRTSDAQWEAATGQLLMDFEVAAAGGTVSFLQKTPVSGAAASTSAQQWFAQGERLEAEDPVAAEAAYRKALELDPQHAYAQLNLGALLCDTNRCSEAVALFDAALRDHPELALLHFNRAIALEDAERDADAIASYQRCLALEPDMADAHYNLARLHEKLGQAQAALRHYSSYRRLHR